MERKVVMKKLVLILVLTCLGFLGYTQTTKIYNPQANAEEDIANAVKKASKEEKHVFLQIGGNWCPWCVKFHNFLEGNAEIKKYVNENFEVVKVNYDQKNKQEELMKKLGFPQRFGFPVFVVLDGNGNRIHTQNSAFLEKDKSYDQDKVLKFFKNWSQTAVSPDSYK